jgi:hypothetical protein
MAAGGVVRRRPLSSECTRIRAAPGFRLTEEVTDSAAGELIIGSKGRQICGSEPAGDFGRAGWERNELCASSTQPMDQQEHGLPRHC